MWRYKHGTQNDEERIRPVLVTSTIHSRDACVLITHILRETVSVLPIAEIDFEVDGGAPKGIVQLANEKNQYPPAGRS